MLNFAGMLELILERTQTFFQTLGVLSRCIPNRSTPPEVSSGGGGDKAYMPAC